MYSLSVILQLIVVLCDCIFVFHVSFVSVVCDRFMCAVTCVLTTMLIVLMSVKYHNCMYHCALRSKKAMKLVMCTVLLVIMSVRCCNSM